MNAPSCLQQIGARRYWPNGDALDGQIRVGPYTTGEWARVVGIVGDVRNDPAQAVPEPMAYGSSRQDPLRSTRTLLVRTGGDPLALVRPVQRELAVIDPTQPITEIGTLRAMLAEGVAGRRLPVLLMTAFGALALLLASVGVYAMFANLAATRERSTA